MPCSRFDASSEDSAGAGLSSLLAKLSDKSEPQLKGFLPLGDSSSLVTSCAEEKTSIWTLSVDLQSSLKADLPFLDKTVSSSNTLKLFFYGPHARDSCKIWDAAIHRVAHFASMRWSKWECKVRLLLVQSGENWETNAALVALMQGDSKLVLECMQFNSGIDLAAVCSLGVSDVSICFDNLNQIRGKVLFKSWKLLGVSVLCGV